MRCAILFMLFATLAAAKVTVTASHPNRLMVDETRLAAIRAKIGTQEWTDFKAYVDANRGNTTSTWIEYLAGTAMSSALLCRVTGKTAYCDSALGLMEAAMKQVRRVARLPVGFDASLSRLSDPINVYASYAPRLSGIDWPLRFVASDRGKPPAPLQTDVDYWIRFDRKESSKSYWIISETPSGAPIEISGTVDGDVHAEVPWRGAGGVSGANAPRGYMFQLAVLYDWLYNYMSLTQRSEWYRFFKASLQFVSILDYETGGKLLNNVWVGDHRGGIIYGIAILGDNPADTASVQGLIDKLDADFETEIAANGSLLTGGFIESTEYTPEQAFCLLELWDAIYLSSGRTDDRYTALQSYYTGMVDYYTHAFHPGTFTSGGKAYHELLNHGDILQNGLWGARIDGAKRMAPGASHHKLLLYLQSVMQLLGDTKRAGYVRKMLESYAPIDRLMLPAATIKSTGYAINLALNDTAVASVAWTNTPISRWFAGTNEVFMKSGWDSNATAVNIFGTLTHSKSSGIDHIRSEAGAINFYRKGTTLTGYWTAYPYDASNKIPYGLSRYPGSGVWSSSYSVLVPAGVQSWNTFISGGAVGQVAVDRYESNDSVTYGDMNLTPSYQNGAGVVPAQGLKNIRFYVNSAHREWMYLAPDIFVIHDKVAKSQATPASQWNLQAQAHSVSLNGNAAIIDATSQFLKATVVLPAAPKMIVKRSDRLYAQWVSREPAPLIVFEANLNLAGGAKTTITLSGATGEWAILNGTWNVTAVDGKHIRIVEGQVDTTGISAPFGGQALILEGHGEVAPFNAISASYDRAVALTGGQYIEVMGRESCNENFLVVLEGVDAGAAPSAIFALNATNLDVAQIGDNWIVGFVPREIPVLPIAYTYSAHGEHRLAGFTPSTTYRLDISSPGRVVISNDGAGLAVKSTEAGVLVFAPKAPNTLALRSGNHRGR